MEPGVTLTCLPFCTCDIIINNTGEAKQCSSHSPLKPLVLGEKCVFPTELTSGCSIFLAVAGSDQSVTPLGNPPHPSFRHLSVVRAKCVSYDWLAKIFFIALFSHRLSESPVVCMNFHKAHLVLDAWLEVTQESVGLVVLHLPVLHRATTQEVIQLWGKDRCRSTLILWTLIPCRK